MLNYLETAIKIAKKAGDFLYSFTSSLEVKEKGSKYDFVTQADVQSQALIKKAINEMYPSHIVIGEEDGKSDKEIAQALYGDDECYFWIVDPLDGTQNYIKHLGGYAVSLSLFHKGEIIVGCTYVPSEKELFFAEKGAGAFRGEEPLFVSQTPNVFSSFLNTGIPTINMDYREMMRNIINKISMKSLNMRIIGSATRSLALTAQGTFDAYFELGPHPWDVGAGILFVEEAGGKVTNFNGEKYKLGNEGIVATNGLIHDEILSYWRG